MFVIKKNTIDASYNKLVKEMLKRKIVGNTKEINNCCIIVNNPTLENISFPHRKISLDYSDAELKWYWSGDNSCKTIGQSAKMWLSLSDDGKTSNSAYGYILFKKYHFNQLEQIIELFKKDINTRRAVLNISDPSINRITTKDMQCTMAIHFLIRNNKLEETVYMRSNDIYFGLPYDYIFFVSIGKYIADRLNIKFSKYIHHSTSMHMYLRDEEKFRKKYKQKITINYKKYIEEYYEK